MIECNIISKNAFQVVGLKWEGAYDGGQMGEIGILQDLMVERINEVTNVVNPEKIFGVSYVRSDGFTLYLCVEVSEVINLPEGMVSLIIPAYTYINEWKSSEHTVEEAYNKIHTYMNDNGYGRPKGHEINIEVYSTSHKCSSKQPFEMDIFIPIESSTPSTEETLR
jgi:predicted transcriptional regulator YdeE